MELNKRIHRILLENKAQYIGSLILILISSFLFTFMGQFASNFGRLAKEFQRDYNQEDASFVTDKEIPDIQTLAAEGNAVIEETYTLDYILSEGITLRLFSDNKKINLTAVTQGRDLQYSGDILINPVFAEANAFNIGDTIQIFDKPFTISGFAALPNYMYLLQSEVDMMPRPGFGIAVISKDDFSALQKGNRFYAVTFHTADESLHHQSIRFRELLDAQGVTLVQWTDIGNNKRVNIVDAEVKILNLFGTGVPTGVLLLATLIVSGIIARLIQRESVIAGTLYAMGYTRKELYTHYLKLPLILTVSGSILGTLPGILPVRYMVEFMFEAFNIPLTNLQTHWFRMIIGFCLPVLFIGLASFLIIRKVLKHSPVELIKGRKEKTKVNFLERAFKLEKMKFPTRFKIREQLRSLPRLIFLLFGLAVATMLLQWGFSLKTSTDFLFTGGVTSVYNFEYEYKFNNLRYDSLPEGVEPFSASFFLPVDEDKRDFYVLGVQPHSTMVDFYDEAGNRLNTKDVIITRPVSRLLDARPGDTVNIVRKLDGHIYSLKIDVIAETYAGKFVYMPLDDYNRLFGMPDGSYLGAFSNVILDMPEDESYSMVTLREKLEGAEAIMEPVRGMIGFIAMLSFIIAMIVIYIVSSMMIDENRYTISLMKIFGYKKREVNALILNSHTLIVIMGYLLGIPLTISALGVLIQSLENSVGLIVPPATVEFPYLLLGFVVVMFAYEVSKRLCRKKITAISMSEALKAGTE